MVSALARCSRWMSQCEIGPLLRISYLFLQNMTTVVKVSINSNCLVPNNPDRQRRALVHA